MEVTSKRLFFMTTMKQMSFFCTGTESDGDRVNRLDLVTLGSWEVMNNLPVGNSGGSTAHMFDGKIHLFHTGDRGVYVYDEAGDSWSRKTGDLHPDFMRQTRVVMVHDSIINC